MKFEGIMEDKFYCRCECGRDCRFEKDEVIDGDNKLKTTYTCNECGREHYTIGDIKEYYEYELNQIHERFEVARKETNKVFSSAFSAIFISLMIILCVGFLCYYFANC